MDLPKNVTKFVTDLYKTYKDAQVVSREDRIEILRVTIKELRRTSDWLDNAYQRMKAKTTLFLGGGLALLTFLYSNGDTFIPKDTAGRIFYFTGLALVIGSLIALFVSLLPRRWEFSVTSEDIAKVGIATGEKFLASTEAYLLYVKEQYFSAYKKNLITYEDNHKLLNRAFYPLVIGAIILIVLKIFGTEGINELCRKMMEHQ